MFVRFVISVSHSFDTVMNSLLQAWIPSNHVWSNFESPTLPHFLNQAPPRAQQLNWPEPLRLPHLEHVLEIVTVVVVVVGGASANTHRQNGVQEQNNNTMYTEFNLASSIISCSCSQTFAHHPARSPSPCSRAVLLHATHLCLDEPSQRACDLNNLVAASTILS